MYLVPDGLAAEPGYGVLRLALGISLSLGCRSHQPSVHGRGFAEKSLLAQESRRRPRDLN